MKHWNFNKLFEGNFEKGNSKYTNYVSEKIFKKWIYLKIQDKQKVKESKKSLLFIADKRDKKEKSKNYY